MKTFYLNILFAVLFNASMSVKAADCSIPIHDDTLLGDTHYNTLVCFQPLKGVWTAFGLTKSRWVGLGWNDVCSINKPLNRTLSALWLLHRSTPNPTTSINDASGDFLRQAYNYAARRIEKLVPRCTAENPEVVASAHPEEPVRGIGGGDVTPYSKNRIELYYPFFYGQSVPERAGTIVHEARHTEGKLHDDCSCEAGGSCDRRWGDKKANTYGIYYLASFAHRGLKTTSAMKRRARQRANNILATRYCEESSFRI